MHRLCSFRWNNGSKKIATLKRDGEQFVQEIRGQGHSFQVRVLGPREAHEDAPQRGDVNLTAVVIEQDWKAQTKLAMVEDANNFLTKAYQMGVLSHAFISNCQDSH